MLALALRLGEPITCATSVRGETLSAAGRLGEGVAQSSLASSVSHGGELGCASSLSLTSDSIVEHSL